MIHIILGKAIFEKLSNDPQVQAIVDNRIYPIISPDESYPLIVYNVSRQPDDSIDPPALIEYNLTISIVSRGYYETCALGNAVIDALDRQHGTWAEIAIRSCNLSEPTVDGVESDGGNVESIFYTQEQTYKVFARPELSISRS